MAEEATLISEAFKQGPYFVLLLLVGYGFYKFLEREYETHKQQIESLQATFKDSLEMITNTFGWRLDKIEDTLERINK